MSTETTGIHFLFTYNRPTYLDNSVCSFLAHRLPGKLVIVDDGSDDPAQLKLLDHYNSLNGIEILRQPHESEGYLGGLYRNMQNAYERALAEGYAMMHFLQDDQQILWSDTDFWARSLRIFETYEDAFEINPGFEWLIFSHVQHKRTRFVGPEPCWKKLNSHFQAPGVFYLPRMAAKNWSFRPCESDNHHYARDLSLSLYLSHAPCIGKVPAAPTWKHGRLTGKLTPPRFDTYLKPLNASQQQALHDPSRTEVYYYEDFCIPWGWKCWAPCHYSNDPKKHLKNLRRWIRGHRYRKWPYRIGSV